jgi:hypothetical protein
MNSRAVKIVAGIVILLVLVAVAGHLLDGGETDSEAAGPASPAPGAIILDPGVEPAAVYRDETLLDGPEVWLPRRGWGGEVKQVRRAGSATRVSLDHGDIRVPGFLHLIVEIPGPPADIRPGEFLVVTGRITEVRLSRDPLTVPHRLHIDNATILEHAKR